MLGIDHLTRSFGELTAVNDVSFTVPDGRMIGFVGGNGAGKTTTMRMIMGLLAPDTGEVRWHGQPITRLVRRRIGYMPEERGLYPKQRIAEQLVYLARLKGAEAGAARAEASALLERFGLADRARDHLEKLSLGNQQRVQIAAAVMASPSILILDEPFSGLDPDAVESMADLLREHASRGVPVLFSSHQLDLIDRICDGLVILRKGAVVAEGAADQLRERGRVRHRLVMDADVGWVRGVPGVRTEDVDGREAFIEFLEPGAENALLAEALRRGNVSELTRIRPTLGEIYREVTA